MAVNESVYDKGAAFLQGKLKVTDASQVENLNASALQGKQPKDFLQLGTTFGITQSNKSTALSGVTVTQNSVNVVADTNSIFKIGNVVIKSSDNGNGILIGIE